MSVTTTADFPISDEARRIWAAQVERCELERRADEVRRGHRGRSWNEYMSELAESGLPATLNVLDVEGGSPRG